MTDKQRLDRVLAQSAAEFDRLHAPGVAVWRSRARAWKACAKKEHALFVLARNINQDAFAGLRSQSDRIAELEHALNVIFPCLAIGCPEDCIDTVSRALAGEAKEGE